MSVHSRYVKIILGGKLDPFFPVAVQDSNNLTMISGTSRQHIFTNTTRTHGYIPVFSISPNCNLDCNNQSAFQYVYNFKLVECGASDHQAIINNGDVISAEAESIVWRTVADFYAAPSRKI